MKSTVIVMGGSFNPPTMAHLAIMTAAMEQLKGERGVFALTSGKNLRKKMRRAWFPLEVLTEKTRMQKSVA